MPERRHVRLSATALLCVSAPTWACERTPDRIAPTPDAAVVASPATPSSSRHPETSGGIATSASTMRGSLARARLEMERFLEPAANRRALIAALAPRPGDAEGVFASGLATRAQQHYAAQFATLELLPKAGETELLMWKVTSAELREGTGDASRCSEDYRTVGAQLLPNLTWYCFRFVKPAEKQGTALEGLVFVNGHWVMFPAPWNVASATP